MRIPFVCLCILQVASGFSTSSSVIRPRERRNVALFAANTPLNENNNYPPIQLSTKTSLASTIASSEESTTVSDNKNNVQRLGRHLRSNARAVVHDLSPQGSVGTGNKVPTYARLMTLASTTVLIWLSEPLLSLVDTTVVGYTQGASSIVQLASLGPATTMMDTLLYMTYFLSLGTTNLLTKGMAERDWRGLQKSTSNILALAGAIGVGVMALVWFASPTLLRMMAGASATPQLLEYAVQYSRVRALAAPFAVMGLVAQSFNLATLNTKRCAWAVVLASAMNICGDLALSRFGVVGVAIATAVASSTASIFLLASVKSKLRGWRQKELDEWEIQQSAKDKLADITRASTSMAASNDIDGSPQPRPPSQIPFFSWPDRKSLWQLATISGPLGFSMTSKMGCYAALSVAATRFGVVPLAVNNIMMRLFYFFAAFGDSMGLAAQEFLPASVYPKPDAKSYRATARRLLAISVTVSLVVGQGSALFLQGAARALARDGAMIELLQRQAPLLASVVFLHPLVVLAEGTIIATRDFRNLIATYLGAIGIHGFLMTTAPTFEAVWKAFVVLQLIRLSGFRIWRRRAAQA